MKENFPHFLKFLGQWGNFPHKRRMSIERKRKKQEIVTGRRRISRRRRGSVLIEKERLGLEMDRREGQTADFH